MVVGLVTARAGDEVDGVGVSDRLVIMGADARSHEIAGDLGLRFLMLE